MALYLVSLLKKDFGYEVVSYDKAKNTAVLRDGDGCIFNDARFYIEVVKRCYTLTDVEPAFMKRGRDGP